MNVSDLREILQYVPRFRERVFVIAIDGEVIASDNFPNILLDLAVLRSLSVKVVLVHGAGYQILKLAKERGVKLTNSDGTGVTDEITLQVSIDAAIRLTVDRVITPWPALTPSLDLAAGLDVLEECLLIPGNLDCRHAAPPSERSLVF